MNSRRSLPLPFLDLLFILLLTLLVITVPRQPVAKTDIENRAEFLIEMTWPDDSATDIDLWFGAPTGEVIWFSSKQGSFYSLGKDDLGLSGDQARMPDGTTRTVRFNQEVVTMRGWTPGRFQVSAHSYGWLESEPLEVTIRLIRLNPFRVEITQQVTFTMRGQELPAFGFTLDAAGTITSIDHEAVPLTRSSAP